MKQRYLPRSTRPEGHAVVRFSSSRMHIALQFEFCGFDSEYSQMDAGSPLCDETIESILGLGSSPAGDSAPPVLELSNCGDCEQPLGWPAPVAKQRVATKACPHCNRCYYVASQDALASLATDHDSQTADEPATTPDQQSGTTVENELLARLVGRNRKSVEKRQHVRYPINRDTVCVPLTNNAAPAYEALEVRLLDMSDTGASLRTPTYWSWPLVVIDFTSLDAPGQQQVARVVWKCHEATGTRIGCEFIAGAS